MVCRRRQLIFNFPTHQFEAHGRLLESVAGPSLASQDEIVSDTILPALHWSLFGLFKSIYIDKISLIWLLRLNHNLILSLSTVTACQNPIPTTYIRWISLLSQLAPISFWNVESIVYALTHTIELGTVIVNASKPIPLARAGWFRLLMPYWRFKLWVTRASISV